MTGVKGHRTKYMIAPVPRVSGLPAQLPESGGDNGVTVDHSNI
jgi:hypothetical protein